MSEIKSGSQKSVFVNVGDKIADEAQYLGSDESTYISDSKVIAAIPGLLVIDEKKRTIKIDPLDEKTRKFPKEGDTVTGQIYSIRRNSIGIHIMTMNNKLVIDMGFTGNIHISKVAGRYIDKIDSVVSKNDFIIAKVVKKNHAEYALRTNDPSLGVIKTYCKYCGKKMDRKGKDQVVCPFCNHFERKLLANDFNEINLVLDL